MHEMGIANSIMDAVRAEIARHPGAQAREVGVKIGELAAIDPAALQFCFQALVQETDLAEVRLQIETCQRRHRCLDCAAEFTVTDYDFQCAHCGSLHSECISGDELQMAYLEIDEHEPSTA